MGTGHDQTVSTSRRIAAWIIDYFVMMSIYAVAIVVLLLLLLVFYAVVDNRGARIALLATIWLGNTIVVLTWAWRWLLPWGRRTRRTPGKRLLGVYDV
jgi:uncharacterized RDD family membrane protein YckC